jgi:phenylpyruvate tautomerase PptA (4-oxalocrotonate tautomerase family)
LYQNVPLVVERRDRVRNAKPKRGKCHMPVLYIDAPPGIRPEAKRKLMEKITAAVDEAYHIGDTLIFLREYPAENVAMDGRLQSENPKILEALKKISAEA